MPSWKKVITSGSSPTFNNVITSGNVSGSSTSVATFGSYGGNVSGSSISTGSFGIILGDGSALTGISAGGSSIFVQTGSMYAATSDLQVTGSFSVLGNISGSFSGLSVGQKYKHSQTVAATTWTVSHNFDYQYVNVDVYDSNDQMVIPTTLTATDSNTITLTFSSPVSGNAIVSTGGQAIDERGKNIVHNQSTPSANWRVTHSIGDQYPSITVYDSDDNVIIPQQINAVDGSKMDITFSEAVSGNANISLGGGIVSGTMTGSAQVVESLPTGTVSGSAQIASDISGSFTAASSSFSTRVTTEEANVDTLQSTMTSEQTNIDNLQTDSGSFSTRVTALKTDSGSFSTRVTTEESNVDTLQSTMTSEQTNIDNLQTDSGSFSTRITSDSGSLSTRVTTVEGSGTIQGVGTTDSPTFADLTATGTVTAQEFHTEFVSASIVYASGSNKFGDTYDDRHEFTGSLYASGSVTAKTFSGTFSGALSGSAQIASSISGSWTSASSSFSTRVTTEESNVDTLQSTMTSEQTNIDNLQTDSGSFSTRATLTEASASNLVTDSGSFSTRVTKNEATGSSLTTASSSFSTRVTTEEANVDTLQSTMTSEQTNIDNLQTDSGSFSTRITTTESELGNTLISGSAQIASDISGSFTATSSSLSTRVTTNEGKATKGFTIAMSVAL